MQPVQGQAGVLQGLSRGAGENGMTLLEKGIEGTAQAIIVELVGGEVPEDVGARLVGPGR